MKLTRDQIVLYWQTRLDGQRINWGHAKVAVKCVLHEDTHPSATLFLDGNSGFNCSGCGRKGNLFQFEAMFSHCDLNQAEQNVAQITGAKPHISNGWKMVACYDYRDTEGRVLFQKRKFVHETEGKTFRVYRPADRSWELGIDPPQGERTTRVLYNLPNVVTANVVCLCEGEKKVDVIEGLQLYPESPHLRVAGTCNFDGAWKPEQSPKWLEEYNAYFAGKWVFIFEDNDAPGRTWGEHIANSVQRHAAGVKIIQFPDLPEKGDVADWMLSHGVEDLRERIKRAPKWKPPEKPASLRVFASAVQFWASADENIEWWVDGVIQKDANGMIVAEPGAGKSYLTADLAVCLATGIPWLGRAIPQALRVGICAREDAPALTRWRTKHLALGKDLKDTLQLCDQNLWINSRQQTPQLLLNDERQVQELISAIRERELQIVFLDVFSSIHTINENKAEEVGPLVETCRRIQREVGCAIGIVHHMNKLKEGSITQRTRGSSALNGWAEWIVSVEVVDKAQKIRRASFEKVKAGEEGEPIEFQIDSSKPGIVRMKTFETEGPTPYEQDCDRKRDGKACAAGGQAQ
jgi:hypothetical protein